MDERFIQTVRSFFHVTDVRDDMGPQEIPAWDSMNYLKLIAALEENFNMTFSMNEVVDSKTLGELRKIVRARGR